MRLPLSLGPSCHPVVFGSAALLSVLAERTRRNLGDDVRIPISLLNSIPAPIAARFRNQGLAATILRAIVHRTMTSDEVVAVVLSGHGRGIRLTIDPTREKYYWAGKHDVPVQDAHVSILHPGAVFWDVGAHVGFFSILAARAVRPRGRVHAFEPMPHNRRRLEEAVRLNHGENVVVHEFAVSDRNGSALLHGQSGSAMWTLGAECGELAGANVACRTIGSLASDLGDADALKIGRRKRRTRHPTRGQGDDRTVEGDAGGRRSSGVRRGGSSAAAHASVRAALRAGLDPRAVEGPGFT